MLELTNLKLRNFFSHKDSFINFESLNGLVLLEGKTLNGLYESNGSGKSSILEGIVYAITGNTLRNVGVNDMVNRVVGKDTLCRLIMNNNGVQTTISRYRKDTKNGDTVKFLEGDNDLTSRLNKSTQETIDNKLGIPYNVLTNTILLGEGLSSRFTQLSDPEKKSLIESTLSLSYDLNSLRDKAKSYIKNLENDIANLSGSISTMNQMIESFNPNFSIEDSEKKLLEIKDTKISYESELKDISSKMELYNIKLNSLEDANKTITDLSVRYKEAQDKLHECENKLSLVDSDNSICSLCGQPLNTVSSKEHVKSVYMEELNSLNTIMNDLQLQLSNLPDHDIIVNKLYQLNTEYNGLSEEYRTLQDKLNKTLQEMSSLDSSINHNRTLLDNITLYKQKVSENDNEIKELEISLSDYKYLSNLFSPTGLLVYILEDALSYINDRMTLYTEMLIDKSYKLKFSKGKITLEDSSGSSYQSLSNGEKRRLDICIQLSLHDYVYKYCGVQVDTLFIDEVLGTLDSVGIDNIFDVLKIKMSYCNLKRVIVITHNNNLKDKFDKVITVCKDSDSFSHIEIN